MDQNINEEVISDENEDDVTLTQVIVTGVATLAAAGAGFYIGRRIRRVINRRRHETLINDPRIHKIHTLD